MINQRNVERLYQLILDGDECLCGSQWEDLVVCEHDTPRSIVGEFIKIFLNNNFREFDVDVDAFVSIANREERKEALIKFFETIVKDLKGQIMNNKSFGELKELVLEWAEDKDLLHSENADVQFGKFIEEVFEFKTEFDYKERFALDCVDMNDIMLEMGDIFVTLIILCEDLGIDPVVCLEMAYKKISKRKGKTINGTFVKSEDL